MRHKDSSKSFGMACFGCLFQKKHSRSRKGKNTSGLSKSNWETSKNLSGRSQSSKKTRHGAENVVVETDNVVVQRSHGAGKSETDNVVVQRSHGVEKSDRLIELRKKIMSFIELIDLPPCIGSSTVIELVKHTVKELQKLHPDVVNAISISDSDTTMDKVINELCASIKSLGKHWLHNDEWMVKSKIDDGANGDLEKHALALLDDIINVARAKRYNKIDMDNDKEMKDNVDSPSSSNGKSSSRSYPDKVPSPTSVLPNLSNKKSAKIYPHVAEGDEGKNENGNPECNVRVQMEISIPSSSLKSIVDSENVQLILAGGSPSSSSERPSISAAIVTSPPQLLDSEATQPQPPLQLCGEPESLPPDSLPAPLPPPPPPPLPPQPLSVGVGDTGTSVPPPPPPPPSMTISDATSVSPIPPPPPPPLPPSSTIRSNTTSLSPPPPSFTKSNVATPPPLPPPPLPLDNGMLVSLGLPPAPPPPPPSAPTALGSIPLPPAAPPSVTSLVPVPQPVQEVKGGAPPPPPAVGTSGRLLQKSVSKLRRSSQMGCLYRQLKAKVEGSGSKTKTLQKKDSKVGAASGGNEKKGMADALAEMTRRSSYFQQIEEDVINYSDSIKEVKAALVSFQTTDMDELINFHEYVESHLEKLTDETQVLARFEDFPSKKLEGLRMAATLYSKLDAIATNLQNWNIEPPANQLIDRIENYFNKIKGELDTLDRTKDEEIKKFKSQKIHFDFAILTRIKELMVDVSSSCMELALKERKLASASRKKGEKASAGRVLWKAFEFAFRVYSFAGGQDDRAENLTKELAQLIQSDNVQ